MTFNGFVNVYCSDTAILQEITPQNIKNHAFCRHRRRAYSTEHTTLHISRLLHVEGRMGFHPSSHAPGPSQTQRGVWKTFKMKGAPHPVQMRCTLYRPASPPPAIMAVPAMTVICRTAMPVSWHPNAAPHRCRPASRNPGITRTRQAGTATTGAATNTGAGATTATGGATTTGGAATTTGATTGRPIEIPK